VGEAGVGVGGVGATVPAAGADGAGAGAAVWAAADGAGAGTDGAAAGVGAGAAVAGAAAGGADEDAVAGVSSAGISGAIGTLDPDAIVNAAPAASAAGSARRRLAIQRSLAESLSAAAQAITPLPIATPARSHQVPSLMSTTILD